MKIYHLSGGPVQQTLYPINDFLWVGLSGKLNVTFPEIPQFCLSASEEASLFEPRDCLAFDAASDGVLISERAHKLLGKILMSSADFYSVDVLGLPYFWLNCFASFDALDHKLTVAEWHHVPGFQSFILSASKMAFRSERLAKAPLIFRLPELPAGYLFACEEFCQKVVKYGLSGFQFELVWSSVMEG